MWRLLDSVQLVYISNFNGLYMIYLYISYGFSHQLTNITELGGPAKITSLHHPAEKKKLGPTSIHWPSDSFMGQEGQFVLLQLRKIFPRLCRGAGAQALVILASSRQQVTVGRRSGDRYQMTVKWRMARPSIENG